MKIAERVRTLSTKACTETKKWARNKYGTHGKMGWAEELGVNYMTVWCWLKYGTEPQALYAERIKERTPDCPLLKEILK